MKKNEKSQKEEFSQSAYFNKNCWLVRSLNYNPYKRCQYCELKFRNCLFLHYQIISGILIVFFLFIDFLIDKRISELAVIFVFTLVVVYGYFFNKSTDKIIKANFGERRAREQLAKLAEGLQQKVDEQTKEIKKAYEIEKKTREDLQRLNLLKTEFMLITQHHLRTPLTVMRGYAELIESGDFGKVSPKIIEVVRKFKDATTGLIKIVNEFLDVSQFQMGKGVISPQPNVKVEKMVEEVVEHLKINAKEKGIYIKVKKDREKIPLITADKNRLEFVLFSVIDNAVKYTNKRGGLW